MWNIFGKKKPIAEDAHIYLRSVEFFDFKLISKWFKNTDIMSNAFGLIADDDYINQISRDYYKEVSDTPQNAFIIVLKPNNRPIGLMRFSLRGQKDPYAIIGILLGENRFLGKGLGTEAVGLVLKYFFEEKHVAYAELDTAIFNERAQRCFKKCGFETVGEFQEVDYNTGNVIYKVLMRIDKEHFFDILNKSKGI